MALERGASVVTTGRSWSSVAAAAAMAQQHGDEAVADTEMQATSATDAALPQHDPTDDSVVARTVSPLKTAPAQAFDLQQLTQLIHSMHEQSQQQQALLAQQMHQQTMQQVTLMMSGLITRLDEQRRNDMAAIVDLVTKQPHLTPGGCPVPAAIPAYMMQQQEGLPSAHHPPMPTAAPPLPPAMPIPAPPPPAVQVTMTGPTIAFSSGSHGSPQTLSAQTPPGAAASVSPGTPTPATPPSHPTSAGSPHPPGAPYVQNLPTHSQ